MDDELTQASLTEQGMQGAAEGQVYQPQVMQQLANVEADRRARMQQQPGMGMGGGVAPPWTAASDQRLQRLSNGLSTVQQQIDSGELAPHEGAAFQQQIQGAMAPLMQQKQQATQHAENTALMQALKHSAMGTAIGMKNMELLTQAYPRVGIARDVDPQTGQVTTYHHDGQGKMTQTDMRKTEAPSQKAEAEFPGQSGDYSMVRPLSPQPMERTAIVGRGGVVGYRQTPTFEASAQGGGAPPPEEFTADSGAPQETTPAASSASAPQSPPTPTPSAAPPDTRHRMTIQNGEHIQQFAFNPNGTAEKVADNHPDWTEIGHSGHQEGEVQVAYKQAAEALAAQGYRPPSINFRAHPSIVAQQIRAYDSYRRMQSTAAQNILQWQHKDRYQSQGQENMMERQQGAEESAMRKIEATAASRKVNEESFLAHRKALTYKDETGKMHFPSKAEVIQSMQDAEEAHAALHGKKLPAPGQQTDLAPQAPGALGQQLLQNIAK